MVRCSPVPDSAPWRCRLIGATLIAVPTVLIASAGSAAADVTSLEGGAFGVSANVTVPVTGDVTVGPTPTVTLPAGGGGPFTTTAASATVPTLLRTGLLTASTAGGTSVSHERTAQSSATVDRVNVADGALTAAVVSARCASNGDGSSGATTLLRVAGLAGVEEEPEPNTVLTLPDVGSVTLNEQIVTNTSGAASRITVNAIHLRIDPALMPGASGDIIIGQARCGALGPDVLVGPGGVVPTPPPPGAVAGLPRTGADLWQPSLAGLGLLIAGSAVVVSSRRRRPRATA